MDVATLERTAEIPTHDLVEAVGDRLTVPKIGTAKLELTFNDGEWVGSNYGEKVKPFPRDCICGRHRWSPTCRVHPRAEVPFGGASRVTS
jgi:hypothetical protein